MKNNFNKEFINTLLEDITNSKIIKKISIIAKGWFSIIWKFI